MLRGHVRSCELGQIGKPLRVMSWAGEESEVDPVQELHLEVVHILDLHARDISPSLVCKGVVVQKLIGEDQSSSEETVLGSIARVDNLVGFLQVDHQLLYILER